MNAKILAFVMGWLLPIILTARSPLTLVGNWKDLAHPEKQIHMYWQSDGKIGGKTITNGPSIQDNRIVFNDLTWDDQKKHTEGH